MTWTTFQCEAAVNHYSFTFPGGEVVITDDDDYNGGGPCNNGQEAQFVARGNVYEGCWYVVGKGTILADFSDYAIFLPEASLKKLKET